MLCITHKHISIRNTHKHISIFKVVSPVWSDLPLTSNVPDIQFEALRLHALNVKALARTEELKLIEQCCIVLKKEKPLKG